MPLLEQVAQKSTRLLRHCQHLGSSSMHVCAVKWTNIQNSHQSSCVNVSVIFQQFSPYDERHGIFTNDMKMELFITS